MPESDASRAVHGDVSSKTRTPRLVPDPRHAARARQPAAEGGAVDLIDHHQPVVEVAGGLELRLRGAIEQWRPRVGVHVEAIRQRTLQGVSAESALDRRLPDERPAHRRPFAAEREFRCVAAKASRAGRRECEARARQPGAERGELQGLVLPATVALHAHRAVAEHVRGQRAVQPEPVGAEIDGDRATGAGQHAGVDPWRAVEFRSAQRTDKTRLTGQVNGIADERCLRRGGQGHRGGEPIEVAARSGREPPRALVRQLPAAVRGTAQAERGRRSQREGAVDPPAWILDHQVREVDAPARHRQRAAHGSQLVALPVDQLQAEVANLQVGYHDLEEPRQEVQRGGRRRLAILQGHLDAVGRDLLEVHVAAEQFAQARIHAQATHLDAHRLVVDQHAAELERPGQRAARAEGLDGHAGHATQLFEGEAQPGLAVQEPLPGHQRHPDEQCQREDEQDPAPAHHSTCVMLRWRRGRRSDSDSACATSMPISSIGRRQRTPMPTEYSSGVLQSLKALPVS